jgi:hypothetical protein
MSQLISTIPDAVDMVAAKLTQNQGQLGLNYVGAYDEKRIPKYPAVVLVPGPLNKEIHSTHTFEVIMTIDLYVYHANLTLKKRTRSKEDLKLVTDIETLLETDFQWFADPLDLETAQLIFGYVAEIRPGSIQPNANKSSLVIGTRIAWRGLSQRRFHANES